MPKSLSSDNIIQLRELASAYRAVLRVCHENSLSSVTIPAISTGIFGLPKELGAAIAVSVCAREADGIDVALIAFENDSYEVLVAAPSARATALLAGNGIID
jgi:O-acetyl-ADP-ribose deacetylase (regulator of RNase III)